MRLPLTKVLALSTVVISSSRADEEDQCGLYLAVSSTSTAEETNWGIFAGKNIPPKTAIGYPEVGINIHNLRSHSSYKNDNAKQKKYMDKIVSFVEGFFWVPETIGAKFELDGGRGVAAIPGIGTLSSYNAKLTNADWNMTSAYNRPLLGESTGDAHPGRGASSHLYNTEVLSLKEIHAGSEIFMEFGDSYGEQEEKEDFTEQDYSRIDETVAYILDFFEKHQDMDDDSKHEVYNFILKDVLTASVGAKKAHRIAKLLPENPNDLHLVSDAGGSLPYSDPTVHRTVKWLSEHGLCMDNIRPGASNIPHAGRGAFATRNIKEGKLIAPVPLTHFSDKRILNMYKLSLDKEGKYVKESEEVIGSQLFENYCFGHPQSSMIFFPSGSGVPLINHSDEPNAKLVWSNHPSHQRSWLELDPIELLDDERLHVGLMMEVVATRSIETGEEIFIDYGPEWKAAWDKHVIAWNSKIQRGKISERWPTKAVDLNDKYSRTVFETEDELQEPYPENVKLVAFLMVEDSDAVGTAEDPKIWDKESIDEAFHPDNLLPVSVVGRKEIEDSEDPMPYLYTVRFGKASIIAEMPHKALLFVDNPGTSDQHAKDTFRHYIGIPDEIFPHGPWRNLA